jgi:hypothetical protein
MRFEALGLASVCDELYGRPSPSNRQRNAGHPWSLAPLDI